MESGSLEGQMRPLTEETWSEFLPEGASPISYLLERDVPVYFRVDPVHHLVYRCYQHELRPLEAAQESQVEDFIGAAETKVSDASMVQVEGFHDDLEFLRLDRRSLEQIAYSMSCPAPLFTRGGLAVERAYRVIGRDARGRMIREMEEPNGAPRLVRVEFDEAVIIDRNAWNQANRSEIRLVRPDPLGYVLQGKVNRDELFLDAIDVARLREERYQRFEPISYPYAHRELMPGIYLMFQAAYHFNEQLCAETVPDDIKTWLKRHEDELFDGRDIFNAANLKTAEKFVRKEISRSQGGGDRGCANLDEINLPDGIKIDKADYEFSYVGPSLSVILALADVWANLIGTSPGMPSIDLAKMLMRNNFAGYEVAHLVYFISGRKITLEENEGLQVWALDKLGKKRRDVMYVETRKSKK